MEVADVVREDQVTKPAGPAGPAPGPRALLAWPILLAVAAPFGLGLAASQLEAFGDDEAAPLLAAFAVGAVFLLPIGAAAGGLPARVEGRLSPDLPRRGDWLRLGAVRLGWLLAATALPWVPLHLLGALDRRAENHLAAAAVALLAVVPVAGFAWADRRIVRRLAARTPGPDGGSPLDRVPGAAWVGGLAAAGLGVPGFLTSGFAVVEADARAPLLVAWGVATVVCALVAGGARYGLAALPGDRPRAAARTAAAVIAGAWMWPYLVALAGGEWLFGTADVHGGRLVVGCVAAAVLLVPVAVASAEREAARRGAG